MILLKKLRLLLIYLYHFMVLFGFLFEIPLAGPITTRRFSCILAIFTLFRHKEQLHVLFTKIRKDYFKKSILAFAMCAIIVSLNSIGIKRNNASTYFEIWYLINLFLYVPVFALYCVIEFKNAKSFFLVYAGCFILQAIVVYMALMDTSFRLLLYELFYTGDDRFAKSIIDGTRIMGIALHSSTGSIICSTSVVLLTYCYLKKQINTLYYYTLLIIFISTTMFIGRTGVLIEIICFVYAIVAGKRGNKIGKLLLAVLTSLIVTFIITNLLSKSESAFGGEAMKKWISAAFDSESQKNTMDDIMRRLPPLNSEFIIGTSVMNGKTPAGTIFDTDSGYIMIYASLGIIGGIFYYIANLYLYRIAGINRSEKQIYRYFILLIILSFAIEYKEPFMLKYIFSFIIVTLTLFSAKERQIMKKDIL